MPLPQFMRQISGPLPEEPHASPKATLPGRIMSSADNTREFEHLMDPGALDRILVKRNEQLALRLEKQQNKFIQAIRKMIRDDRSNLLPPAALEVSAAAADNTTHHSSGFETKDRRQYASDEDFSAAEVFEVTLAQDASEVGNMREARRLASQTLADLAAFAAGDSMAPPMSESRRRASQSEQYDEAKKVSTQKISASELTSKGSLQHDVVPQWRRKLREVFQSFYLQLFFAAALAANSLFIGVEVEYIALNLGDTLPTPFMAVSSVFAFIFLVELVINLLASGVYMFFCSANRLWNWLDIFVVASSLVDLMTDLIASQSTMTMSTMQIRLLRVLRIARIARVIRILKVVKTLRALKTLCQSIAYTLRSLLWATVLIALIIYCCGILFTSAVTSHLETSSDEDVQDMHDYFGTVHRSMHTLFRSISGGLSWTTAAASLEKISWFWMYLFTAYIAFVYFAVLNVMTGVFCQSAIESAQKDKEMAVHNVLMNRQRFETMLMDLFRQIDEDGSGTITITEFENHFEDQAVKFLLHGLELEVEDAWTLFNMLDQDGDHAIEASEFLDGCMHLKGNAKALDLAKLNRKTDRGFKDILFRLDSLEDSLQGATSQLSQRRLEANHDRRAVIAGKFNSEFSEGAC